MLLTLVRSKEKETEEKDDYDSYTPITADPSYKAGNRYCPPQRNPSRFENGFENELNSGEGNHYCSGEQYPSYSNYY